HVALEVVLPDRCLVLVGREDHQDVGPAGRFLVAQHLEARAFGLLRRSRTRTQRDRDILYATVAQVLRMGVTLAAVAEPGDLLVRDQVQVPVGVVVNLPRPYPVPSHPRGNGDPLAVGRYTRAL